MSARSTIAILENDTIKSIYCHWDGYLTSVGRTLFHHYSDPAKVRALITLGDISSLGPNLDASYFKKRYGFSGYSLSPLHGVEDDTTWLVIAKQIGVDDDVIANIKQLQKERPDESLDYITRYVYENNYTTSSHRDRGEPLCITTYETEGSLVCNSAAYLYGFINNQWCIYQHHTNQWYPLSEQLVETGISGD